MYNSCQILLSCLVLGAGVSACSGTSTPANSAVGGTAATFAGGSSRLASGGTGGSVGSAGVASGGTTVVGGSSGGGGLAGSGGSKVGTSTGGISTTSANSSTTSASSGGTSASGGSSSTRGGSISSGGTTSASSGGTTSASGGSFSTSGGSISSSGTTSASGGSFSTSGGRISSGGTNTASTGGISSGATTSASGGSFSTSGGRISSGGTTTSTGGISNGGSTSASGGSSSASGGSTGGKPDQGSLPNITVHLAGDSTMANYAATTTQEGWGQEFGQFFSSKVTIDNQAQGGANVQTFYSGRWKTLINSVQAGDYVMAAFGINDSGTAHGPVTPTDFQAELSTMADEVAAKKATFIPTTSSPLQVWVGGKETNDRLQPYCDATIAVGKAKSLLVDDLNARGVEYYNSIGQTAAAALTFNGDKAHFDKAGATAMAQLAAQELTRIGSPLAAYLK